MDIQQRNQQRLAQQQLAYSEAQLSPTPAPQSGFYGGYQDGRHVVKLQDGSIAYGECQTNGAIAIGSRVSVSRSRGSTIARFDAMPG